MDSDLPRDAGSIDLDRSHATADEQNFKTAIELFAERSYAKTIAAVDAIAASGADHAPAVLAALAKRRVYLAKAWDARPRIVPAKGTTT